MCASVTAIASAISGVVQLFQAAVAEKQREQDVQVGVLQQEAAEQAVKEHDETIAKSVAAQPTPTDKSVILSGLSAPPSAPG